MIKLTDFKVSLRRMWREKQHSLITVAGLASGMAGALIILLFLQFELSYDRYHPDHRQIYRLATVGAASGEQSAVAVNTFSLGPLLQSQFAGITGFTRIFPFSFFFRNQVFRYEDKHFYEQGIFAADSSYFDFFSHRFIHGNPQEALREPMSLVMTHSMALRYFGADEMPLGKIIRIGGEHGFRLSAVIEDPPRNSHFQFDGLVSLTSMRLMEDLMATVFGQGVSWQVLENHPGNRMSWLYVKTAEGFSPEQFLQEQWPDFYAVHLEEFESGIDFRSQPLFQPMQQIHLGSKLEYEMSSETGAVTMMSHEVAGIFFVIALFLLLIASINHANLAVSRFSRRSREIGIRKVLGAGKGRLVFQFLIESLLTTLLALLVALTLVELMLPRVNLLLDTQIQTRLTDNPWLLLILLGIALFTGLVSGLYPSLYFASFRPVRILNRSFTPGSGPVLLKKTLIILQFVISVFMVIATLLVHQQLRFMQHKDLGFARDHVLVIEMQEDANRRRASDLKAALLERPQVLDVAVSNYFPSFYPIQNTLSVATPDGHQMFSVNMVQVAPDFADFMGMKMHAGRFFDGQNRSDLFDAVVINKTASRHFGWGDDAVGLEIHANYLMSEYEGTARRVIGVIDDFYYASMTRPIEPMLIFPMEDRGNFLLVRVDGSSLRESLAAVELIWGGFAPQNTLVYQFLDESVAGFYASQRVLSQLFAVFALLCIIISFMGVYGMSAYTAEQRTREISIRKVLGAGLRDILIMLHREFSFLLVLAFIIASLLSYFLMNRWLEGFALRIPIGPWAFVFAGLIVFFITYLAVGVHAFRTSRRNPAETLHYD